MHQSLSYPIFLDPSRFLFITAIAFSSQNASADSVSAAPPAIVPQQRPWVAVEPPPNTEMKPVGPKKMLLLIGPGFGLSFMYPTEVNEYLDDWVDNLGYTSSQQGSSAIVLALQPRLALTFAPIEYVQIQVLGEVAWAPKVITVLNGDTESFHFLRISTGGTVSGHIPLGNGRKSLSFGAGVLFNVLKFEDLKEIAPGFRGLAAFRFYTRKRFVPEIFLEFNWIKADTGLDPQENMPEAVGNLSFVSGTIGANFYFKVTEKKNP